MVEGEEVLICFPQKLRKEYAVKDLSIGSESPVAVTLELLRGLVEKGGLDSDSLTALLKEAGLTVLQLAALERYVVHGDAAPLQRAAALVGADKLTLVPDNLKIGAGQVISGIGESQIPGSVESDEPVPGKEVFYVSDEIINYLRMEGNRHQARRRYLIICLHCRGCFTMLSNKHLQRCCQKTPGEYKAEWGLLKTVPLCSEVLTEKRKKTAKKIKAGTQLLAWHAAQRELQAQGSTS